MVGGEEAWARWGGGGASGDGGPAAFSVPGRGAAGADDWAAEGGGGGEVGGVDGEGEAEVVRGVVCCAVFFGQLRGMFFFPAAFCGMLVGSLARVLLFFGFLGGRGGRGRLGGVGRVYTGLGPLTGSRLSLLLFVSLCRSPQLASFFCIVSESP